MQQRGLRLVGGEALLNMFDDGIDIAKGETFFCRQLKLPADTLLREKGRPAALPGVRLRRG